MGQNALLTGISFVPADQFGPWLKEIKNYEVRVLLWCSEQRRNRKTEQTYQQEIQSIIRMSLNKKKSSDQTASLLNLPNISRRINTNSSQTLTKNKRGMPPNSFHEASTLKPVKNIIKSYRQYLYEWTQNSQQNIFMLTPRSY